MPDQNKPRVLFFDIETTPNLVYSWGIGKQFLTYENIYKEKKISCICYKWSDERAVRSLVMDLSLHDISLTDDAADYALLRKFSAEYAKADLVVGHNAARFDIPTVKARLLKYGLGPLRPVIVDDTYLAAIGINTNCHRLDYIAQYLGVGRKNDHPYKMWVDVMAGDKDALEKTRRYCVKDVVLLAKVYKRLLPHIKSKLNRAVAYGGPRACPHCGLTKTLGFDKLVRKVSGIRHSWKCKACGKYCSTYMKGGASKYRKYPRPL